MIEVALDSAGRHDRELVLVRSRPCESTGICGHGTTHAFKVEYRTEIGIRKVGDLRHRSMGRSEDRSMDNVASKISANFFRNQQ